MNMRLVWLLITIAAFATPNVAAQQSDWAGNGWWAVGKSSGEVRYLNTAMYEGRRVIRISRPKNPKFRKDFDFYLRAVKYDIDFSKTLEVVSVNVSENNGVWTFYNLL